jgi:hypothetical protein
MPVVSGPGSPVPSAFAAVPSKSEGVPDAAAWHSGYVRWCYDLRFAPDY